jgi:hypothetical protein
MLDTSMKGLDTDRIAAAVLEVADKQEPATLRLERPGLGLDHRRFASTLSVIRQRLTRIARAIALLFQRPSPKSFCRWQVPAGKRRDFRFRESAYRPTSEQVRRGTA